MSAPELPLQDLAQRLTQKQAELDEARRAYEARLADLARRKDELQTQLRALDAEIQAVGPGTTPGRAPTAPSPAVASAPATAKGRGDGAPTLARFLLEVVRAAGRPLTAKELAEEVVQKQYPTTSRNIPGLVKNTVSEMVTKGVLRRAEGQPGVTLPRPQAGKPAPAAKAAPTGKKAGTNGKAAQTITPEAAEGVKGKVSLTDLLTRLLRESDRPLKARELAERALAAGYQTQSKDFVNVVWVALAKLDVEKVPDQGYRLKKGATKRK